MDDATDIGEDKLPGVPNIAKFINETNRRTYYLLENKIIPGGKYGNIWIASKRRLREHYDKLTRGDAA